MSAHDLLQISGVADLVYVRSELPEKRFPLWVELSLQEAPFVVVRRADFVRWDDSGRGSRFIAPAKICRLPRPRIDPQPNYSRTTCHKPRMAGQRSNRGNPGLQGLAWHRRKAG